VEKIKLTSKRHVILCVGLLLMAYGLTLWTLQRHVYSSPYLFAAGTSLYLAALLRKPGSLFKD
jgi:hypothetical protein